MLIVISPAKTLDFESPPATDTYTQPDFLKESKKLVRELQQLTPEDISKLMGISPKLGELNFQRYMNWKTPFKPGNARQAVLAFKGDVYTGLDAQRFSRRDFDFAQKHLRILSGLYGVLRPLDLMQPYRLEMGTRLPNPRGDTLYDFWGGRITEALNEQLAAIKSRTLINLASNEYFKAVQPGALRAEVITPVFKDLKGGKYKVVSFYAKKARGLMSAYIIVNRLRKPDDIKGFDWEGYSYNDDLSTAREWVFTRDRPA